MIGTGRTIVVAVVIAAASAAGVFLALEHGAALMDRLRGRDNAWIEFSCRGTKAVSEHIGPERITHATQEVTERIFVDARSIGLSRSDGGRSEITDFTRNETMAEWRQDTDEDRDGLHRHTLSTVGNLFFKTETLMIRDIETVRSGGWDYQRSSLLTGTCHVLRTGRY